MWIKENDFNIEKALLVQKFEFAKKELTDSEERLESQKSFYLKIISALKQSDGSPTKDNGCENGIDGCLFLSLPVQKSIHEDDSKIRESI